MTSAWASWTAMAAAHVDLGPEVSALVRAAALTRSLLRYYGVPRRAARMRRFYAALVPPGSVCFDIGAHVGNRVRCWRQLGARVVAVEPHADCARLLHHLYGRDAGVSIVQAALGAAPGEARLLASPHNLTVATLSQNWTRQVGRDPGFAGIRWSTQQTVPVTTLTELIAAHGEPAFVKIDVEGYEAQVLRGLDRALTALSFECLPAARDIALDCVSLLEARGSYRYSWSPGESHRLHGGWRDAAALRRHLAALPDRGGGGDVYARLCHAS